MTAKDFWDTQIPTDANKCYVHDYYARKFSHEDLFRFAEAYASLKVSEATKEMYPRSFIEWKDVNARRFIRKYVDNPIDTWFQVGLKDDMSFDELFEYWEQNISK